MNRLPLSERIDVLALLIDGASQRATSRVTGVALSTVARLLVDAGRACRAFHAQAVRLVPATAVEVDEVWSFCYAKAKNVSPAMPSRAGDVWTWTAMEVRSRLIVTWAAGDRTQQTGRPFFEDLKARLMNPCPITTDQYGAYPDLLEAVFGEGVDHRMVVRKKEFEDLEVEADEALPNTNRVERHNLNIRMGCRRFTRRTNAFSKRFDRHEDHLALSFVHYNFVRAHGVLKTTPAHAVGLTEGPYDMEWLAGMIEAACPKPNRPKRYKIYPKKPLRNLTTTK